MKCLCTLGSVFVLIVGGLSAAGAASISAPETSSAPVSCCGPCEDCCGENCVECCDFCGDCCAENTQNCDNCCAANCTPAAAVQSVTQTACPVAGGCCGN